MTPQAPEPTRTLLVDEGLDHRIVVDTDAYLRFCESLEQSLTALEAKWATWAPPIAHKANRRDQFGR